MSGREQQQPGLLPLWEFSSPHLLDMLRCSRALADARTTMAAAGQAHADRSSSSASDLRTVEFRNSTDVWVLLESQLEVSGSHLQGSVSTVTQVKIAPNEVYTWNFLGESMNMALSSALADSYSSARKGHFRWTVATIDPGDDDSDVHRDRALAFVQHATDGRKVTLANRLSLAELPELAPGASCTVTLCRKTPGSLRLLSACALLRRLVDSVSNEAPSARHQRSRTVTLALTLRRLRTLPLPNAVLANLRQIAIDAIGAG